MKWMRARVMIPALILLLAGGYFAGKALIRPRPVQVSSPRVATAQPAAVPTKPVVPTREPASASAIFGPPRPLTEIYQRSAKSVRTIHSDDWNSTDQDAENLSQVVDSFFSEREPLPPSVASPYAIDDLVAKVIELQSAVVQRDRVRAELAANRISGLTIDMLSHYDWTMPVALARLDYLGNDMVIWAESGNERMARRRLDRMKFEWQQVKPQIVRRGGARQAEAFDQVLVRLVRSRNIAEMDSLSDDLFARLAALEALFN